MPRREPRYRCQIPVVLRMGRQATELVTEDISFSGMFLRTDAPPPERGLIKVQVPIPGDVEPLELTAMVVHTIEPGASDERRVPGAGVQIYGVGAQQKDRWARYVMELRSREGDASTSRPIRVELSDREAPEPINRRFIRYAAHLEVRCRTVDELVAAYTRDISQGGSFLATRAEVPVKSGDALFLELIHPDSGKAFGIECVVRRKVREGVGVEFQLDAAKKDAFWEFVEPVIELDEDDFVLLD